MYVTGFVPYGRAHEWGRSVAMVLEKTDPDGRQVWIREWRSSSRRFPDAAGWDVAAPPDGAVVYVAGSVMLPPWEAQRLRLWAYSPEGILRWTQRSRMSFAATAGPTGVVVGSAGSLGALEPDGRPLWIRDFVEPEEEHCDVVGDVALGHQGEIYAVGYLDMTPTCAEMEGGAFEDADIVMQKRSPSGELIWSQVLTDPEADNDSALSVAIAGRWIFVAGVRDGRAWLARLSTEGEIAWERRWGGTGTVHPVDLCAARPGAVYVLANRREPASHRGPVILRRYTLEGNLQMERRLRLHGEASASGVATGPDEALYVTAHDFEGSGDLWRLHP